MNRTTTMMGAALVSIAVTLVAMIGFAANEQNTSEGLSAFSSELELRLFLTKAKPDNYGYAYYGGPFLAESDPRDGEQASYSGTNIQVAGVDEDDVVKTDGEYIFVASSNNVTVIKAFPPESLENVSRIEVSNLVLASNDSSLHTEGIFVRGDRLVLIVSEHPVYYYMRAFDADSEYKPPKTIIATYDITDRSNPSFVQSLAISGNYLSSRMNDGCVYLMTQAAVWTYDDQITIPSLWAGDESSEVPASDIRYDRDTAEASSFMNLLAVDVETGAHDLLSIVAGWASNVYMSNDALYFTVQKYRGAIEWLDGGASPEDPWTATTSIYKIAIDDLTMTVEATGQVKGWLLNQFSMDDNGRYLRVATTTSWVRPENAVYVLDDALTTVGSLEGLAPDERIYSSRFIGDVLYLVTFRQMDPLFVIDLSNPEDPNVVGELKIPGFSSYLHPVGANHILGIGSENGTLKVSLFDVSDPTTPVEQSHFVPDARWYSDASYDHKAILFDLEKELLVIPAYSHSYEYGGYSYTSGAMVFRVSISDGISLRGIITHETNESPQWSESISRSLYIGDYLYTIGPTTIQVNLLEDLSYIGGLTYNEPRTAYWYEILV